MYLKTLNASSTVLASTVSISALLIFSSKGWDKCVLVSLLGLAPVKEEINEFNAQQCEKGKIRRFYDVHHLVVEFGDNSYGMIKSKRGTVKIELFDQA